MTPFMGNVSRRRASGPRLRVRTSMLATGRVIGMVLLVVAVAGPAPGAICSSSADSATATIIRISRS